jgi:eukaryotic-like serine/threonine-protein kinase
LEAQRFDARSHALRGSPRTISEEIQYLPQIDLALFSVTGPDTLVLQTGKGAARSQLRWFDRSGKDLGAVGAPGEIANPSLSPDGQKVAFDQTDPDGRKVDIWIRDLRPDAVARFTFGPSLNNDAIWSPDGKHIVFTTQRGGISIFEKNADGSGTEHEISNLGMRSKTCWDWSHDGKYFLVRDGTDLAYVTASDGQVKPLLRGQGVVLNARFSPDGRWVAYSSNESGHWEVYVTSFPAAKSKWQVSTAGGEEPRWRRDGKELFYLSGQGTVMAAAVKTGSSFEAGPPSSLFQAHTRQAISTQDVFSYDVTEDGNRFLVNTNVEEPSASPLSIILNWASEVKK